MTRISASLTLSLALRCIRARNILTPSAEPPDFSGEDTPFNLSPFFDNATSAFLYGYYGCKDLIGSGAKAQIDNAYHEAAIIASAPGVAVNIDFNTAAALDYLGAPGYNFDKQPEIQAVLQNAADTMHTFRNVSQQYIKIRCDDPARICQNSPVQNPCQPNRTSPSSARSTPVAYASISADPDYPTINFCEAFFGYKSLDDAIAFATSLGYPSKLDMEYYENRAHVVLHEILHLYSSDDFPRPLDVQVDYIATTGPITQSFTRTAYGTMIAKILARWTGGPLLGGTGYWVQRNSDNLSWYILAQYITYINGNLYPNYPLVTYRNRNAPHLPPGRRIARFTKIDGSLVLDSNDDDSDEPFWFDAADGACFNQADFDGEFDADFATVTIDDMVPDSAYPDHYHESVSSWIASLTEFISAAATSSSTIPTNATFISAIPTHASFNNVSFSNASFSNAGSSNASFSNASFTEATLAQTTSN